MIPLKEYGYKKGMLYADWGCPTCRRVVYQNTTKDAFSREHICHSCQKANKESERRSKHLWELTQTERPPIRYKNGIYGIRDDLFSYLIGMSTPIIDRNLQRVYTKLDLQIPQRIIPTHHKEF